MGDNEKEQGGQKVVETDYFWRIRPSSLCFPQILMHFYTAVYPNRKCVKVHIMMSTTSDGYKIACVMIRTFPSCIHFHLGIHLNQHTLKTCETSCQGYSQKMLKTLS